MALIQFEKFNLNNFYEKTPRPLKYILVISLIIVGSYFLYAKKLDKSDIKQLDKIEESIKSTYTLIDKFDDFRQTQYVFNEQILEYLEDLYTLVEELNYNTNKKLDLILKAGGSNTEEIIERLEMLNETYEKLREAYTPKEFKEPYKGEVIIQPVDEDGNPIDTGITKKYSIGTKK
jgi:hypothetical protein